eukprot:COSAG01_NODE_3604_length_5881_cov_6.368558_3_plen_95_part_00
MQTANPVTLGGVWAVVCLLYRRRAAQLHLPARDAEAGQAQIPALPTLRYGVPAAAATAAAATTTTVPCRAIYLAAPLSMYVGSDTPAMWTRSKI